MLQLAAGLPYTSQVWTCEVFSIAVGTKSVYSTAMENETPTRECSLFGNCMIASVFVILTILAVLALLTFPEAGI